MKHSLKSSIRAVTPQSGELHEKKSLNALNGAFGKIKRHSDGDAGISLREYRKEQQKADETLDQIFNILQELCTN